MIGIIDNIEKYFCLEAVLNRDENTIKKFINIYVESGNNICSDGWAAYNYLDNPLSGNHHYRHSHGSGDFGIGVQSTSHIETIWAQIKSKLKENYHIIPPKKFMLFVREVEFKIKIRNMTNDMKLKFFFDSYETSNYASNKDINFIDNCFLNDYSDSNSDDDSFDED